jgi:murein DD-endopeptidase MepM/ murein hydrolase activator NlpD
MGIMKKKIHKTKIRNYCYSLTVLICSFSFLLFNYALAQPQSIKKSNKVEVIEGKKYYIHSVEKGQTLYSIAKTYSTTVDVVLANNQDAIDGLKPDDKLRIPFIGSANNLQKTNSKQNTSPKPEKESRTKASLSDTVQKYRPGMDKKTAIQYGPKKDSAAALYLLSKPPGNMHVAIFLPLDLEAVENMDVTKIALGDEKIPEETKMGIEFYEGVKLAFDSLRKQGAFKGHLHIYDYTVDSISFAKLLKKPELKGMDLILGPLYGKKFESVLKFAKENNIPLVAPTLLGNNILLGNPNASKITPSYITQTEVLSKYIAEKFAGQNILLFNSANPKDKPYLNTFKRISNPILQQYGADTVKEITLITMKNFMSKTKANIVAIPSTNQSFITESVNTLFLDRQEEKDSIIVAGLSNFIDMESLDFGYLKTLNAIISSHTFINYSSPGTKKFIVKYRREFKTDPTQYVFSGFDATYFYLSGLQKYGSGFQKKLPELKERGIQTEFNFYQTDTGSGYENRAVGIMKFDNYAYTRVQ